MKNQKQNRTLAKSRVRYQHQETTWTKKPNPKKQFSLFQKENPHLHIHSPEDTGEIGKHNPSKKPEKK